MHYYDHVMNRNYLSSPKTLIEAQKLVQLHENAHAAPKQVNRGRGNSIDFQRNNYGLAFHEAIRARINRWIISEYTCT